MPFTSQEILGTICPDGSLQLDGSISLPPGRVKIRFESLKSPAAPVDDLVGFVQSIREDLAAAGHRFRTKEEIDAELDDLRGEWNDDQTR
jgi:hypothetical protein